MESGVYSKYKKGLKLILKKVFTFEVFNKIDNYCVSKHDIHSEIINKMEEYFDLFFESYIFEHKEQLKDFLTLNEVKKMLNYSDNRSVRNWCSDNGVFVIHQGNAKIVNKIEFTLAFQKPLIQHLKRTHKNWKERLSNYMNLDLNDSILNEDYSNSIENLPTTNYKPKSEIEKSFLKNMNEL